MTLKNLYRNCHGSLSPCEERLSLQRKWRMNYNESRDYVEAEVEEESARLTCDSGSVRPKILEATKSGCCASWASNV